MIRPLCLALVLLSGCAAFQKGAKDACDVVAELDTKTAAALKAIHELAPGTEAEKKAIEAAKLVVKAHHVCYDDGEE